MHINCVPYTESCGMTEELSGSGLAVGILSWNGSGEAVECLDAVLAVAPGSVDIVIVDNGSTDGSTLYLKEYVRRNGWICVQESNNLGTECEEWYRPTDSITLCLQTNPENRGVGAGFLQIIELGLGRGAEWVWLLDQDSRPKRGALGALVYEAKDSATRILIPSRVDLFDEEISYHPSMWTGRGWRKVNKWDYSAGQDVIPVDASGFSGMLLGRGAVAEIGYPRSDLFVGYEDYEYCLRARELGESIAWVRKSVILHRVGESSKAGWPMLPFVAGSHKPYRYYYMARNRIFVHWQLRRSSVETLVVIWGLVKRVVKVFLAESEKVRKAKEMGVGTWAGFRWDRT